MRHRSTFDLVGDFHRKLGLPAAGDGSPRDLDDAARDVRLGLIVEELRELADAYGLDCRVALRPRPGAAPDLAKIADALVDLDYVVLGTAHVHRLPWPALVDEVHRANMAKDVRLDGVGHAVKPADWRPPDVVGALTVAGWPGPRLPLTELA